MGVLLPIAVLVLAGCVKQDFVWDEPAIQIVEEPPRIELGQAELEAQMSQADAGDNFATVRVAEHFEIVGNPQEELRWLLMAAERGHVRAMYSLSDRYLREGVPYRDCAKALYWLVRADQSPGGGAPRENSLAASAPTGGSPDDCALVRTSLGDT